MGKLVISLFLFLAAAGQALAQAAPTNPPMAAPNPSTSPPSTTTSPPKPSPSAPSTSTRFSTEAAAKEHCPDDTVVWTPSSRSRVYYLSGARSYGRGKGGAYMCQKDAQSAGIRQSRRRARTSSSAPKPASTSTSTSGSTNK